MLEEVEFCLLADNGNVANSGLHDHVVGVVCLVNGNGNALGGIRDLGDGIDDAAVVLFTLPGSEDKEAVGELEEGSGLQRALGGGDLHGGGLGEGSRDGVHQGVNLRLLGGLVHR